MKNHYTLCLLIAASLVFHSCTKTNDSSPDGTDLTMFRIGFSNSLTYFQSYERDLLNRIKSVIVEDSTNAITTKKEIVYDTDGKITTVNAFGTDGTMAFTYEFDYNPDGNIRKRSVIPFVPGGFDDYNTYAYDAAGRLIADSQFSHENSASYHLLYVSHFTYTGENITGAEQYQMINDVPVLLARVQYEYDNSLNPFRNIRNHYYYSEWGSSIYSVTDMSLNNVKKKLTENTLGGYDLTQIYSYNYSSNNYPATLESTNYDTATPTDFEVDYYY